MALNRLSKFFTVLGILASAASFAQCPNCRIVDQKVIFPLEADQKAYLTRLAWSFKGVKDVDYQRVLDDENYARPVFDRDINFHKVTNYIVDKVGRVLAEVPDKTPEKPTGGVFIAAGIKPYQMEHAYWESPEIVYFQINSPWSTQIIRIYEKVYQGRVRAFNVSEVKGIDEKDFSQLYKEVLQSTYSSQNNYRRDQAGIHTRFESVTNNYSNCKKEGYLHCFKLRAHASTSSTKEDAFQDRSILVMGIKKSFFGNYSMKLLHADRDLNFPQTPDLFHE